MIRLRDLTSSIQRSIGGSSKQGNGADLGLGDPLTASGERLFPLNWVIVHVIDRESPLWGLTQADLELLKPEFLVLLQGYDETFAQDIHANSSYTYADIVWNKKFVRMYESNEAHTLLHLDKIDELQPLPDADSSSAT